MDLTQKMDPELIAAYQEIPAEGLIDWNDLPAAREMLAGLFEQMTADVPDSESVEKEDRKAPGPEGAPEVPVRVYRPKDSSGTLPRVLWIHGGGYVVGSVEQDDLVAQHVYAELAAQIQPRYRRLGERYDRHMGPLEAASLALSSKVSLHETIERAPEDVIREIVARIAPAAV